MVSAFWRTAGEAAEWSHQAKFVTTEQPGSSQLNAANRNHYGKQAAERVRSSKVYFPGSNPLLRLFLIEARQFPGIGGAPGSKAKRSQKDAILAAWIARNEHIIPELPRVRDDPCPSEGIPSPFRIVQRRLRLFQAVPQDVHVL